MSLTKVNFHKPDWSKRLNMTLAKVHFSRLARLTLTTLWHLKGEASWASASAWRGGGQWSCRTGDFSAIFDDDEEFVVNMLDWWYRLWLVENWLSLTNSTKIYWNWRNWVKVMIASIIIISSATSQYLTSSHSSYAWWWWWCSAYQSWWSISYLSKPQTSILA